MFDKKSTLSMHDDTTTMGKTVTKNRIDQKISTVTQEAAGSGKVLSRTNLRTKSILLDSNTNVDNVSDNEALLNKHLFRTPTANNAPWGAR